MDIGRRDLVQLSLLGAGALLVAACGRGRSGPPDGAEVIRYGEAPRQRLELTRAVGGDPTPVVVLVHGGFWRNAYDLDLMRPLVPSLVERGWAVANVEYRSLGDAGGGWPGTFDDVGAAIDALRDVPGADLSRVVAVGHSAGGHLAAWAAARTRFDPGAVGADPVVRLRAAVPLAGVLDLATAADDRLGGGAASTLLGGGPEAVPDVYAGASPIDLLPMGVPVVAVHGRADELVPFSQSEAFVADARAAGDPAELVVVPGGHFELIDPTSDAWRTTLEVTARLLG